MSSRVGDVGDDDPSSSAVVARARVLRETLRRRDDDYEVDRPGARASLDAIVADPAWLAEYEELKRLERALAGEPGEGRCARYVPRKRRFCAAKARDGGTSLLLLQFSTVRTMPLRRVTRMVTDSLTMESKIIRNGAMASKAIPTTPKCPPYIAAKFAA